MSDCNWPLGNGKTLEFSIHDKNTRDYWNDVAGLYIFASKLSNGSWCSIYIGQTNSFKDRLPDHERLQEAIKKGATHIHVRVVQNQNDRNELEKSLIQTMKPTLNVQLV